MKKLFLYILFLLVSVAVGAQNSNTLSIPDVSTPLGQAQLPVVISNTDEIVAVQFDLTLPNGITADETVTLTNRADGHTATARNMGNGIYRVVLFAQPTKPLLGQSGTVMNIPITVPENYEEGSVHELVITNAVLTDKTGANVLTQSSAGSITVSKLPDLTVKSITADKTTLNPGDHFTVSWQACQRRLSRAGEKKETIGKNWKERKKMPGNHSNICFTVDLYRGKQQISSKFPSCVKTVPHDNII